MIRASLDVSFPWRTKSPSAASAFSFVMTAAPTPASRVFFDDVDHVSIVIKVGHLGNGKAEGPRQINKATLLQTVMT
jgi:hypothetical protein